MKKVTFILFTLMAALSLTLGSCQLNNKKNDTQSEQAETTSSLSVDELLSQAESLNGTTVSLEGVCTHICAHGAKKIFLMGTDDTKTIRIEATDATGAFSQDCVNSFVSVSGKVVEERIDEAYLANWEASIENETAEEHGDGEEAGCSSEQNAQNEAPANTVEERIENFRKRIAEEKEKTGKDYLSFYHVAANSYDIN